MFCHLLTTGGDRGRPLRALERDDSRVALPFSSHVLIFFLSNDSDPCASDALLSVSCWFAPGGRSHSVVFAGLWAGWGIPICETEYGLAGEPCVIDRMAESVAVRRAWQDGSFF